MAQIVLSGSALCPSSEPESLPLLHLPFCYSLVGNLFEFRNPSFAVVYPFRLNRRERAPARYNLRQISQPEDTLNEKDNPENGRCQQFQIESWT
jgi:hypothetical protein